MKEIFQLRFIKKVLKEKTETTVSSLTNDQIIENIKKNVEEKYEHDPNEIIDVEDMGQYMSQQAAEEEKEGSQE